MAHNLIEVWAEKTDNNIKVTTKLLTKILYTDGEPRKENKVLEIVCPEHPEWQLDINMKILAKILGEKGILHLVDEYCKQQCLLTV